MTLMVGRQPILDQHGVTYGYELLYRGDGEHEFLKMSAEEVTSSVINSSFYETEIGSLSSGKVSFINFTAKLIIDEIWRVLPKHRVVIEFLESVEATPEIIAAVKTMKAADYRIALDDFVYREDLEPLIELADIIKVDIRDTDSATIASLARRFLPKGKILLAEKVETLQEFKTCRDLGYTLFQGYFFARPSLMPTTSRQDSKASKLRLMQKIHDPDVDYGEVVEILKADPNLSLKLLKYINSVAMGVRHEITSLRMALALIGLMNFKKWASVLIMASFSDGKPMELLRLTLIRGRLCELLSEAMGKSDHSSEYFLVGIFSLLDATLDKPMDVLVKDLPLADDIIETLLGHETRYQQILSIAYILESNIEIGTKLNEIGCKLDETTVAQINQSAIIWSDEIIKL